MTDLKIEYLPVTALKPYERNAKLHPADQVERIANSLIEFGWRQPCVVDSNNVLIAGHGRLLGAKKAKEKTGDPKFDLVPCVRADDLTPEQIKAYRLVDNKTNESEWDLDILPEELESIIDIDMSQFGFDINIDEDQGTKLGDVYQLGQHRLICGDSTDPAVIDRLMDGAKADMVFTDPPYGVNVKGGKNKGNLIMGDLTQTAIPFSFEIAVTKCTKEKAHFYFCGGESNIQLYQKLFDRYLHMLPKHLIWVKNGFVMKHNGYHNQFEIIYHGYKQGSGGLWYGGRTEKEASDVWHIDRDPSSTYLHPTQKPLGVPARAIKNSCPPNGSVVDLFGGSGSTLIACEQLNRKCYMCELDPHYCDVIIQRWENFTGEKAVFLNG